MARIINAINAGRWRVLVLDSEISIENGATVSIDGHRFDAATVTANVRGIRMPQADSIAIKADPDKWPASYFVGREIALD